MRRMLEIDQIVSKYHMDTPTAPLSGDFRAALRFFFDIFGGIREGAEGEKRSTERSRLAPHPRCHIHSRQSPENTPPNLAFGCTMGEKFE